jgi:type II secretory pathway pseudopilin PulG
MQRKTAFSFFELSIVILIISIIIAGVTQSQIFIQKGRLASAQRLTVQSQIDKIDNLIAWFETSLESSFDVNLDLDDGVNISIWRDHSANNIVKNNAIQTAIASRPQYVLNAFNSLPALRFDGNDFLNFNASALEATPYTIFIVEQRTTNAANNFIVSTSTAGGIDFAFGYSSNTNLRFKHTFNNTDFTVAPYDASNLVARIHTLLLNSVVGARYYLNGSNIANAVNTTQINFISQISGAAIGASLPDSSFYVGDIFEIIIFNRNLRDEERRKVANYLLKKYSI